jgi:hypothetical protein
MRPLPSILIGPSTTQTLVPSLKKKFLIIIITNSKRKGGREGQRKKGTGQDRDYFSRRR